MNRKQTLIALDNALTEEKEITGYAFFVSYEDGTVLETTCAPGGMPEEHVRNIVQKMRRWASALGQQLDARKNEAPKTDMMCLSPEVFNIASEIQKLFEHRT
jgi:hypothetical protein